METNHIHEDVPGGVPLKMWTRGVPVEDEAKRQLQQRRAPALRLQAHRGHARRALRHRRDRRLGDPDHQGAIIPAAVGVDIGCGMMAVQDHADAPKTCPTTWRRCARPSSARCRTAASPAARDPGAWQKPPGSVNTALGAAGARVHRAVPRLPQAGEDQPHPAPGHAGHRQPLHRGLPRRSGLRVVHAALGLARRGQPHRHDLHRAGQAGRDAPPARTCRTGTWPTSRKAAATSATTCAPWAGRRSSPRINREVMMKRVIDAAQDGDPQELPEPHRGGELPPQLREQGAPLRRGRVRHPQGRGEREGRASWASSPAAWARAATSCAARATRTAFESCSHGAGRAMSRGEAKRRFTLADHRAATEGVECRKDKDVIDETPDGLQGHRRGDGGAARPGRGGAHAEAGGVREGVSAGSASSGRSAGVGRPVPLGFQ